MATVNLGNIKLNWKGAYNAGTAYVIDDVVSYNGSSYVCISATTGNLPTVTAKWNQMSAAGTNGTDVGTTITTQGDMLYRDGSGLQRLAKGTAGQVLKMNSSANAPEWGTDIGGKLLQVIQVIKSSEGSTTSTSYVSTGCELQITPAATSSKILLCTSNPAYLNSGGEWYYNTIYRGSSTNLTTTGDSFGAIRNNGNTIGASIVCQYLDSPNTTSQITYKLMHKVSNNGATGYVAINNWNCTFVAMEIGV